MMHVVGQQVMRVPKQHRDEEVMPSALTHQDNAAVRDVPALSQHPANSFYNATPKGPHGSIRHKPKASKSSSVNVVMSRGFIEGLCCPEKSESEIKSSMLLVVSQDTGVQGNSFGAS